MRRDGNTLIQLSFGLATPEHRKASAIQHLDAISNPDSPIFGRIWDRDQVAKHFAPSPNTIREVARWLAESGIPRSSMRLSVDRSRLSFNTTVDQAETLLDLDFNSHTTLHARGNVTTDPAVDIVDYRGYHLPLHISGKVNLVIATTVPARRSITTKVPPFSKRSRSHGERKTSRGGHRELMRRVQSTAAKIDCLKYTTPDCLRAFYNIPSLDVNATAHPRSTLGIYETAWTTWLANDMDTFFATLQPELVGQRPVMQAIDGGYRYLPSDPSANFPVFNLEADLDFQYAMSLAHPVPVTNIQVGDEYLLGNTNVMLAAYDGSYCAVGLDPNYDPSYPDVANAGQPGAYNSSDCGAYEDAVPLVISISAAWNEASFSAEYAQRQCDEFLKLALQGTTVIAATGDYGTADQRGRCLDPETGAPNATEGHFSSAFPASCLWVTAVGGTQRAALVTNTTRRGSAASALKQHDEVAFAEVISGTPVSSSGGFSNIFDQPYYQAQALPQYLDRPALRDHLANLSAAGYFRPSGRGWPDVSALAKDYLVAIDGSFYAVGGTSAAAPVFASMVARINDARLQVGKTPVGFVNPVLYARFDEVIRTDVVSGANGGCGVEEAFSAAEGWDAVTGLGTVDFGKLMDLYLALP